MFINEEKIVFKQGFGIDSFLCYQMLFYRVNIIASVIVFSGFFFGHYGLVERPVELIVAILRVVFDLDSIKFKLSVAVDRDNQLALQVLFRELRLVHHNISASLKASL